MKKMFLMALLACGVASVSFGGGTLKAGSSEVNSKDYRRPITTFEECSAIKEQYKQNCEETKCAGKVDRDLGLCSSNCTQEAIENVECAEGAKEF